MKSTRFTFFLLLLTFTAPAFAYIDPGTGSLWLQTIIALLAGCGVTVKVYWQRFKQFFSTRSTDKKVEIEEEKDPQ